MELSFKQTEALDILENQENGVNELLFGGGAGGGKSLLGTFWLALSCINYPGTRWLMGRSKLKTLKGTTLKTFFEVCKREGWSHLYKYNEQSSTITWYNGSEIVLKDLKYYPTDPDYDELGSLEISGAFIDEVGQITKKCFQIVRSRIRYKLLEYKLNVKILGSCNPSRGWVYNTFFSPDRKGTLRKDRYFIQSLVTDNPKIAPQYIESLKLLDSAERERLLYGNWDFEDDPSILCNFKAIESIWTNSFVAEYKGAGTYISADIALHGSDKFVVLVWYGFTIIDYRIMDKTTAPEVEKIIRQLAITYSVPQYRIAYDADGLGSYLMGYMSGATPINNGARAIKAPSENDSEQYFKEKFKNLKSQLYFKLAAMINANKIYIEADMEANKEEIQEELAQIKNYSYGKDQDLAVLPKDKVKEAIGRSPDWSDAIAYRMYFALKQELSTSADIRFYSQALAA